MDGDIDGGGGDDYNSGRKGEYNYFPPPSSSSTGLQQRKGNTVQSNEVFKDLERFGVRPSQRVVTVVNMIDSWTFTTGK
jgi:hypothetical protein